MTESTSDRVSDAVEWLQRHVRPEFMARVSRDDLSALVRELLFGHKELWRSALDGILTEAEACSVLVAHVDTWALHHVGESYATAPDEVVTDSEINELRDLIFGKAGEAKSP